MQISYFYKKTTLPKTYNKIWFTRFGSLQLHLSFFKVCNKTENNELAFSIESLTAGALGSVDPTRQRRQNRARRGTTRVHRRRPSPVTAPTQP